MAKRPSIINRTVAEFIDEHPNISSKKMLSRMLCKEYPQLFTDVEHARQVVRRITGAFGSKSLKEGHEYYREMPQSKHGFEDPILYKPHAPVYLPNAADNILLLSDAHVPFQDVMAQDTAVDYGLGEKVNTIVLLGDILDFYRWSDHRSDPRAVNPELEIEIGKEWLYTLRDKFPKARIYYKLGNHEFRYERQLWLKAPEWLGIKDTRFENIFDFEKLKITYVHNKAQIRDEKFTLIHGHEADRRMWGSSPISPARTYWNRFQDNIIGADKHRTDSWPVTTGRGVSKGGWCLGCICDLSPEYASINQWNHGFGHIKKKKNGNFRMRNMWIIEGDVLEDQELAEG